VHPNYEIPRFVALKASHLAEQFLRAEPGYVLIGYGRTGKLLARELRQLGCRPSYVVEVHPGRIGQVVDGAPVLALSEFESLGPRRVIVSVAGLRARGEIRRLLRKMGKVEGRDFVCAA
jgi:S-adenosylhomocysteine hydrolase